MERYQVNDKRRHKRFTLNLLEVNGTLSFATKVSLLDISMGGLSLKANIRLNMGGKYIIKLEDRKKLITVKGVVVWSRLTETRMTAGGESIPLYTAGMKFIDLSEEKLADLLDFVEHNRREELLNDGDRRLNIRFHITDPEKAILNFPASYKVKTISLGGMLIECIRALEIESKIPMDLSIQDDITIKFVGRVASCQAVEHDGQKHYAIGIEFLDVTDKDRELLTSFMTFNVSREGGNEGETVENKPSDDRSFVIPREAIDKVEYLYKWHETMGYYKMLGIKEHATDKQITHAFHAMAQKYHPDKFSGASDDLKHKLHTIFVYLNTAVKTLLDPQKRKEYDKNQITRIRR